MGNSASTGSRARLATLLIAGGLLAVAAMLFVGLEPTERQANGAPDDPPWALLGDGEGFERPRFPREARFPDDHGPHPGYRTEWWNLAGSLDAGQAGRVGFQLTIVRLGLAPEPPDRASRWAATDVYAGVFSLTDPRAGRLLTDQRTVRGAAVGLAGAAAQPRRVWVGDWQIAQADAAAPGMPLTLQAATEGAAMSLTLEDAKPLLDENVIRGPGTEQGAPFHFYLQPRLRAHGRLELDDETLDVRGVASLEHAWGELPLPGGPVALDRFTLHLDDGRELLLTRTHRVDGSGTPDTTGLLIDAQGQPTALGSADVSLRPTGYWTDADTGARYPVGWKLQVPGHALELELSPYHDDQAGSAWQTAWVGPVRIRTPAPNPIALGHGLVQLTGYEHDD